MTRAYIIMLIFAACLPGLSAQAATNHGANYILTELASALRTSDSGEGRIHIDKAKAALQEHDSQGLTTLTEAISAVVQYPVSEGDKPDWKILLLLRDVHNFTSSLATKEEFFLSSSAVREITKSIGAKLDTIQRQYRSQDPNANPNVIYQSEESKDGKRYLVKLLHDKATNEVVARHQPLDQSTTARTDLSSGRASSPQMTDDENSTSASPQKRAQTSNDGHPTYEVVASSGVKFRPFPGGTDPITVDGKQMSNPALASATNGHQFVLIDTKTLKGGEIWGRFDIPSERLMPGHQGESGWCLLKYFQLVEP